MNSPLAKNEALRREIEATLAEAKAAKSPKEKLLLALKMNRLFAEVQLALAAEDSGQ
jgi:hypothetical protein